MPSPSPENRPHQEELGTAKLRVNKLPHNLLISQKGRKSAKLFTDSQGRQFYWVQNPAETISYRQYLLPYVYELEDVTGSDPLALIDPPATKQGVVHKIPGLNTKKELTDSENKPESTSPD